MRSDEEIIARIEARKAFDLFGFETPDLIVRLSFAAAKPYLNDTVTEEDWQPAPRDRESLIAEMREYMPFAWDKANGCRGISASRSMAHYTSWTWLAGDDFGDLQNYQHYGKENLRRICDHYAFDATQWDDGVRVNSESELA